ncbi:insulinase family protein [Alkalibacterium sp. 20]|uniref:insulinase family protein n=1 Tax=Alkalibacterium sp. 20 TaxID=1798803 RepID=UPI0009001B44|nr:insulinase family protein [Alkalibacterium sp. 20]OJF97009.1 peptidase M16 [Alkalibacterium sp. 20]
MVFKKIETQNLPDIHSEGHLYEHEETGAQVLYLANDDTNKSFTIGFKTPPYNDNGIAHILEHSVLNGSKKYPSKEPFVELIKGSLNTFVNAMTFSDKTIYPVASTNEKDFGHLMGVYLDAVFQPKLYQDPQILAQEGWHYHLENEADDLIYKGVVYNEMKGAAASPERQLYDHVAAQLYPNTVYSHNSGGDPKAIPTLTQEEFITFHQMYYHPSNSLTIVYGDLNITKLFDSLEEYFTGMGKQEETVDLSIEPSQPKESVYTDTYSITVGDDPTGKDYLALGWHGALPDETLDIFGLEVLDEILFGNNQSPLKKALLDADIGGDIDSDVSDIGYPTAFLIMAKYSSADKMPQFKQVVEDTLTELVEKGIKKDLIQAALNKITFQTREAAISEDNPRGVIYAIQTLNTWLYGKDPFVNLQFNHYLEELAKKVDEGYFEDLIKRKFLNNDVFTQVILKAEPGKSDKLETETLKKLQEYKGNISDEERTEIIKETQALIERQGTPDSPEDLAKIPTLKREDLTTEEQDYPIEESVFNEDTSFYHTEQFTSGIDYINLYFDIKDFKADEYSLLGYFSHLLGKLATEKYDEADLQTEMDTHTGGIYGSVAVYEDKEGNVKPYFKLSGKALAASLEDLVGLMKEIMLHTQFDKKAELLKITQRLLSNFEQKINFSSHAIVANRALSQVKPAVKISESINGIDQFNYLKVVRDELKSDSIELNDKLTQLLTKLLNKRRLHVLYTGGADRKDKVKDVLISAFASLQSEPLGEAVTYKAGTKQNEAYVTAQDVNYVGLGSDATGTLDYTGMSLVLSTAFRFDYLWNEIRVKGGAYGSLYQHNRTGSLALGSYRDPNIGKTLAVYKNMPTYVKELTLSESELLKYIIGSLSPLEQPKSAESKGLTAFNRLKRNITKEDIIQLKEEILATDSDKLSALHDGFTKVIDAGSVVVIGNKAQIENEKDLFDKIYDLY